MEQGEIKQIYELILDFWKYIKATIDITDNDEYWHRVDILGNELYTKHNNHPLALKLILAYVDYLEDERKRIKQCQNTVTLPE